MSCIDSQLKKVNLSIGFHVLLSAENKATFGKPTAVEVFIGIYDSNMEDFPVIRRDIDGYGKKRCTTEGV